MFIYLYRYCAICLLLYCMLTALIFFIVISKSKNPFYPFTFFTLLPLKVCLCFSRDACYHGDSIVTNLHLLIFGISNHFSFQCHNAPMFGYLFKGAIGTNRLRYTAVEGWHDNFTIYLHAPFLSCLYDVKNLFYKGSVYVL